jgi:hypothetical protein
MIEDETYQEYFVNINLLKVMLQKLMIKKFCG